MFSQCFFLISLQSTCFPCCFLVYSLQIQISAGSNCELFLCSVVSSRLQPSVLQVHRQVLSSWSRTAEEKSDQVWAAPLTNTHTDTPIIHHCALSTGSQTMVHVPQVALLLPLVVPGAVPLYFNVAVCVVVCTGISLLCRSNRTCPMAVWPAMTTAPPCWSLIYYSVSLKKRQNLNLLG